MDATTRSGSFTAPAGRTALAPATPLLLTRGDVERLLTLAECIAAIAAGLIARSDVHAQLGEVIAGIRPGRTREDEIIVFDSSRTAPQDVAAAAAVYRRALGQQQGVHFSFNA